MKKILVCCLSIFAFLFLFDSNVSASGYEGKLGYQYSASFTEFFYLNYNDDVSVTLHIEDVADVDMIHNEESSLWYASVEGDLNKKEYYYEICYSDLTCVSTLDPFANTINVDYTRNVVLDGNDRYVEGYKDLKTNTFNYYNNSIYAIEAEKFVEGLTINTEPEINEDEEIEGDIPGEEPEQTPVVEYKDSIFNRLSANANYTHINTGFKYLISLNMKNLEIGNLYDSNNYFSANQMFSTKENNYTSVLELKNFILKYNHNKMNVIARMDLLNPSELLKESLTNISEEFILENGMINLNDPIMQRYIIDVYKYWVSEYKVNGFYIVNADSYGQDFLNKIISEIKLIDKNSFIYTDSLTLGEYKTSDDLQNILFGSLFDSLNQGIVNGNFNKDNFEKLINAMFGGYYSDFTKAVEASKVINNIGSFAGIDIYSKIMLINGLGVKESDILNKIKLGIYTIFSSSGIPRLVAGNEFLNTKSLSYNADDLDSMVCADKLCYAKGDSKTINWAYLLKNGSDIAKLMVYRNRYIYQYPNNITMTASEKISYKSELFEKGILYLNMDYKAKYKGEIERTILLINYSDNESIIDAISSRDYASISSLIGKVSGDDENTKISGYTFYTFSQTKEPKFSDLIYVLIAGGLLVFIFGIRQLLIYLLKTKKGIDYKEYNKEQRQIKKANKKKKVKPEKEPSVIKTYLQGDSFVEKISEKISTIGKNKKKSKKEVKEDIKEETSNENDQEIKDEDKKND